MSHFDNETFRRHLHARGLSAKTQSIYVGAVRTFFRKTKAAETSVDEALIRSYLVGLAADLPVGSSWYNVQRVALLAWCEMRGLRVDLRGLSAQRRRDHTPRWMEVGEVQRLVPSIANVKYRMVVQLMLATGLRPSEALHLRVTDLSGPDSDLIHVRGGKGGHDRYVHCPASCWHLLRAHWRRWRPKEFLFERYVDGAPRPLVLTTVNNALRRAARAAGVALPVTLHRMRHTYGRQVVVAGVDLVTLQKQLGHRCIQSTLRYVTPDHRFSALGDADILERLEVQE